MDKEKQSKAIYAAKGIALLLIVWAHMSLGTENWMERLRISLCQCGVTVFFVCSGFFYRREKGDTGKFWRKKLVTVIAPWLLLATATFALSVLLSRNLSGLPIRYIKWVLGVGSPYWFLSALVICFAVFKALPAGAGGKMAGLLLMILVSLASVVLSVCSVIPYGAIFNQYTNVFNWLGWFALGMLLREKNLLERITSLGALLICGPLWVLFLVLSALGTGTVEAYIHIYSLPAELFGTICVLSIARLLYKQAVLADMGKKSFFVYLIHIQIAGIINSRLPGHPALFVVKPIIVVAVCYLLAICCQWILKKMGLYQKTGKLLALR